MKHKIMGILLASVVAISSFVLAGCSGSEGRASGDPSIEIETIVANPNIEEYKSVEAEEYKKTERKDFRIVQIKAYISYSEKYSDMKVTAPKFKGNCGEVDGIQRYVSGTSKVTENDIDRVYEYNEEFLLYAKGMKNEDIKKLIEKNKLSISYKNGDETEKQTINLARDESKDEEDDDRLTFVK